MKDMSKALVAAFLVGGLALIVAAFFLFLKECQPENLFYLNLTASCAVYMIAFFTMFDVVGSVDKVGSTASGFGLRWISDGLYALMAVALIVLSIVFELPFKVCLIVHMALLLCYLFMVFISSKTGSLTSSYENKEKERKSGLEQIKASLAAVELKCRMSSDGACLPMLDKIREELRFISPGNEAAARMIEDQILDVLLLVDTMLGSAGNEEKVKQGLEKCLALIDMRKKQY